MKKSILMAVCLSLVLMATGCGDVSTDSEVAIDSTVPKASGNADVSTSQSGESVVVPASTSDMFTSRDQETADNDTAVVMALDNQTVTITEAGTYHLSGSISNGQIIVDVADTDKVQLVLDNVSVSSSSSAALYVRSADKVFVTLADGSVNTLTNGGSYVNIDDNNIDGAVFSKSDLTFNGTGSLSITAGEGHGIVCKDDLVMTSGTYSITAASHGVSANNSIRLAGVNLNISAGKDGLQADHDSEDKGFVFIESGTYDIKAVADGIQASSYIMVEGGTFDIVCGGGYTGVLNAITVGEGKGNYVQPTDNLEYSMKAVKATNIIFNGGIFRISAYEDALHADGDMEINDGQFYIYTGDDGVHADNLLVINGGYIEIIEGYEGFESGVTLIVNGGELSASVLDDSMNVSSSSGEIIINGGTIYLQCQGDGIDSNGSFTMTGGHVTLNVNAIHTGGDGNIDVDGTVTFTGGTIVDAQGNAIDPTVKLMGGGRNDGRTESTTQQQGGTIPGMDQGMQQGGTMPGMDQGMQQGGTMQGMDQGMQQGGTMQGMDQGMQQGMQGGRP